MIDTDLLDLINGGNAWLFVGSGVSIDAGLPTWKNMVTSALARLPSDKQEIVVSDVRFQKGMESKDYAQCFQRMQEISGREHLTGVVRQLILETTQPGHLTTLLADWPAAGYLTTNYDNLIESALEINKHLGWISVGNQQDEIRKASGDARDIVWHIHGSAHLPDDKSRLIVGSKEYDDLYLDNSPLQQQLQGFLIQKRLVFAGFGLQDPEIMRLLKIAGRYTIPERPIYAFLGSIGSPEDEAQVQELRDSFNIEVIQYRINDDSHADLRDLLDVYSAMIVRRSVNYGSHPTHVPSYDTEATGLLIYNTLVLQSPNSIQQEMLGPLLSARILSVAEYQETLTLNDLCIQVGRITAQFSGEEPSIDDPIKTEIRLVVEKLEGEKLITAEPDGQEVVIRLTSAGHVFVAERAGVANRIRDQFRASITSRATEYTMENPEAAEEVAIAAGLFFEDCIEKRSLGVAMVLNAPDYVAREFQMVALLQALPNFFDCLSNQDSARALVKLVQGVLSAPSEAEAKHCGLLLQARLGVHLLGVDQSALRARMQTLKDTAFLLDSTSLIPLLAVSGTGHRAAIDLISRIKRIGAKAFTTSNLVIEAREHAGYATRSVQDAGGALSAGVLNKLLGKDGERTNVFLSGFAEEVAEGSITGTGFGMYMLQTCGFKTNPATTEDCNQLLESYDVPGMSLSDVTGFDQEDHAEVEELRTQIEERRRQSNNYRHDRQVLAEAEAVVLVQKLRDRQYKIDDRTFGGAFFVSNSRFIDRLQSVGLPITMRQNVLLQWLGTAAPFEESELPVLMDGLLWELSERGLDFVDRKKLRTAFSSTISAAREEYPNIVAQHKILIATEWGVDPEFAFQEPPDDLILSTLIPRHAQQTIDRQQREIQMARSSVAKGQQSQELSQSERRQLERLKSEKARRVNRNRLKAKSRVANPKKKRR